jgi:hypothetical protein
MDERFRRVGSVHPASFCIGGGAFAALIIRTGDMENAKRSAFEEVDACWQAAWNAVGGRGWIMIAGMFG